MRQLWKAALGVIIMIAIVAQTIPLVGAAEALQNELAVSEEGQRDYKTDLFDESIFEEAEEAKLLPYPIAEITEERDTYTKVFRMSDGSYTAAVYPQPVHFEQDGEMKEIDNTLKLVTEDGRSWYKNQQSSVQFSLPAHMAAFSPIQVEAADGSQISFVMRTGQGKRAAVAIKPDIDGQTAKLREFVEADTLSEEQFEAAYHKSPAQVENPGNLTKEEARAELTELGLQVEKNTAAVTYREMTEGVDLRYSLQGTQLKEEIILNKLPMEERFIFTIQSPTLQAVLMEDGSVDFIDEAGTAQMHIAAPFMYDAAGASSGAIEVELIEADGGLYFYELVPDRTWLTDAKRAYPVIIDPPLQTGDVTTVKDTTAVFGTSKGNLATSGEKVYLKAGLRYDSSTGKKAEVQSMLYSPLPAALTKHSGVRLLQARIYIHGYNMGFASCANTLQLNAYRITKDWDTSNMNDTDVICLDANGNADYSDVLDFIRVNDSGQNYFDWYAIDITKAAQQWLDGLSPNYGVALRATGLGSLENFARFYDSTNTQTAAACPKFAYQYRDAKGVEDYWTFTSVQAGRNGTAAVNNFNGNPVVVQDLCASTGERMPVSLSLIYSMNSNESLKAGLGFWRTNYHMYIESCDIQFQGVKYPYCFVDSDGTRHYLYEKDGKYIDEDGLGLEMTVINEADHRYKMITKDKTEIKFDWFGRLKRITDGNGNYNRVLYVSMTDAANHAISAIEEGGSGSSDIRTTTFSYSGATVRITPPGQNNLALVYSGSNRAWLDSIYYPDSSGTATGGAVAFTYNTGTGALLTVTDGYGRSTKLTYTAGGNRIAKLQYGGGGVYSYTYNFAYAWNATTVTDQDGRAVTYQFNNAGHTVGVVDHTSSMGQSYAYGAPGGTKTGEENKLLSVSKTITPSQNRINSGSFFSPASVEQYTIYPDNGGFAKAHVYGPGNSSPNSMYMSKTAACNEARFVYVTVHNLSAGKYTLSGYIRTDGALSGKGVYLGANIFNANGYRNGAGSVYVNDTGGEWVRVQIPFQVQAGDTYAHVGIYFNEDTHGSAWLDDIQLEYGDGAGSFNYVYNNQFLSSCSGWSRSAGVTDGNREAAAPANVHRQVNFTGSSTEAKQIGQRLYAGGNQGDVFIFGGWARANSIPLDAALQTSNTGLATKAGTPTFALHLTFYKSDVKVGDTVTVPFNHGVTGWQYVTGKALAPGAYDSVQYVFSYNYNTGSVAFGSPFLYKESYGQSYTYDGSGNVVSSESAAETNARFAYTNEYLTRSLSPSGSGYVYNYNGKTHNMQYALSSSGQRVDVTYNSTGGATKMEISEIDIAPLTTGSACYIISGKTGRALTNDGGVAKMRDWKIGDKDQQWWLFNIADTVHTIRPVTNGDYALYAGSSSDMRVDYLGWGGTPAQYRFGIHADGDGVYRIVAGYSDYVRQIREGEGPDPGSATQPLTTGTVISWGTKYRTQNEVWYFVLVDSKTPQRMESSAAYTADGHHVASATDSLGNTTEYTYNAGGLLSQVKNAKGETEEYTYDRVNRTKTVASGGSKAEYTYAKDQLTEISMNDGEAKYHFDYDALGRKIATQTSRADSGKHWLAEYTYTKNNMTSQRYSNGVQVDFGYDNLDRLVEKRYGDFRTGPIRYSYDPNGNLYKVSDGLWSVGIETEYTYDLAGRIVGVRAAEYGTQNHRASMEKRYTDQKGTVESQRVEIYGTGNRAVETAKYTYRYGDYRAHEMPGVVYDVDRNGEAFLKYTYDGLGRVTSRQVGGLTGKESYTYSPGPNGTATTQVQKFRDLQGLETTYTYDANGNITAADSEEANDWYVYDALGRMVRANNGDGDVRLTETYEYDARGNIVSRTRYSYTTAETPTRPKKTITYKYEDDSWADLLTEYDGETLTYDNIGNPLTYRDGMTMSWKHGRSLRDIQKGGETLGTYNYNGDGLRTYKSTNGNGTVEYHILDGTYVGQTQTINGKTYHTLYLYDDTGSIIGLQDNGETYYFVKNLQGDVIGILDSAGEAVGYYFYDVWGNIAKVYKNSNWDQVSDPEHIALRNPFRYRGYMYDEESGLYYLQSRYYDPVIGRFVNADNQITTGSDMTGTNLFTYCGNNPANRIDPTGEAWWHWALGAVVVAACAVATVVTAGGFAAAAGAVASVGSGMAAATTASTVAAGAFVGSGAAFGTAAFVAAGTSNSPQEFASKGNWGTVAATAGGAILGGANAYTMTTKGFSATTTKAKTSQSASRGSTGRTQPVNLREQLAMEQVKSNPFEGTLLKKITMKDPLWPASEGWVKMQQIIPTSQGDINIHYVYNETLELFDDFKFNP